MRLKQTVSKTFVLVIFLLRFLIFSFHKEDAEHSGWALFCIFLPTSVSLGWLLMDYQLACFGSFHTLAFDWLVCFSLSGHIKPLYPMPLNLKTPTQVSLVISACFYFLKGIFIMLADLGIFDYFISSLSSRHIHAKCSKYSKLILHWGNWSEGGKTAFSFPHLFFFFFF